MLVDIDPHQELFAVLAEDGGFRFACKYICPVREEEVVDNTGQLASIPSE